MKEQFKLPSNFPIPRKKSVIVKQIKQGSLTTESGLIIEESSAANVERPNVGLIYAVGEDVPEDLKPGLKVYYNQYCNLEVLVNGSGYVMLSETDVFCILNEGNHVSSLIKPEKEVRRGKKIIQQQDMHKRISKEEANKKDKREETYKKIKR